jgi:hypothetical protein
VTVGGVGAVGDVGATGVGGVGDVGATGVVGTLSVQGSAPAKYLEFAVSYKPPTSAHLIPMHS